jgi:ABC-type polysaccharide/polyol phosphate export permease
MVAEMLEYRQLLYMLAWRDIKIRYKQSVMGFLWAMLMPVLIVTAGAVVRYAFSMGSHRIFDPADLASVSLKSAPWAFFVGAIRFATNSLTSNSNLVTKIYFPREVLPLSAVLASLFDFAVASSVVALILVWARIGVSVQLLWLPFILLLLIILTAGLGMFLACANLFFRDVKYLVEVFLTFGILFTPVFYEARMFRKWAPILLLNPIAAMLESMNDVVVLHKSPNSFWLAYAACWSLLGFLISGKIFDRTEPSFAESI